VRERITLSTDQQVVVIFRMFSLLYVYLMWQATTSAALVLSFRILTS